MIRFNNDYNHGAHPEILEALGAINENSYGGYGEDEWCEKAAELIREKIRCADAAVHFFPGATQANFIVTAAALSPVQSVIAADILTAMRRLRLKIPGIRFWSCRIRMVKFRRNRLRRVRRLIMKAVSRSI